MENFHEQDVNSLEPYAYLLQTPGKNIRDLFIDAFNDFTRVDDSILTLLKEIISMLHNASLLIDDIEDESTTRRGTPTAHKVFGVARTLNAGNYVYFLAMEKLMRLPTQDALAAMQVFTEEMCNLHRGQGRDIWWRETQHLPLQQEYEQMVIDKTGGLFRLALRLMLLHSDNNNNNEKDEKQLVELANRLALYFQIRDDLINLVSSKYHTTKGYCEDITEGKLSFIVIHALSSTTHSKQELWAILRQRTTDMDMIKQALEIIKLAGSFDYTVQYLQGLKLQILQSIAGRSNKLTMLVEQMAKDLKE